MREQAAVRRKARIAGALYLVVVPSFVAEASLTL
jgi:hypothetical protein